MNPHPLGMAIGGLALILIAAIVIVIVRQISSVLRARTAQGQDQQYQQLAERMSQTLAEISQRQQQTAVALENISTRVTSMERLLAQID